MSDSKQPAYELIYFALRGRGEMIRLLFHATKTPFKDTLIESSNWASMKSTMPLGQLPVLIETVDGVKHEIPQSFAILRHLARRHGLYGSNEEERIRIDVVSDTIGEWRAKFGAVFRDKEKCIEYFNNDLPKGLALMEKLLGSSTSQNGYFVSDKLSYADIVAFDSLDTLMNYKPAVYKDFAKLTKFLETIRNHENLKAYIAGRKKMEPTFVLE